MLCCDQHQVKLYFFLVRHCLILTMPTVQLAGIVKYDTTKGIPLICPWYSTLQSLAVMVMLECAWSRSVLHGKRED